MPLRKEVDIGSGDIVSDGDPAALPERAQPLYFRPISVVAKWLDGSTWYFVRR